MTAEETTQTLTMGDVPKGDGIVVEIPNSPCTPRPKKDKQAADHVCVSPWNPLCKKMSMEDKGKTITIETSEEE